MANGEYGILNYVFLFFIDWPGRGDAGPELLLTSGVWVWSARFCSKTAQGIPKYAFSRFGRCLNAVCCLVFRRVFAHISQSFDSGGGALRGTRRRCVALHATDAESPINALPYGSVAVRSIIIPEGILVKWTLGLIKETEMVFGNFEGKDVRSESLTAEHFWPPSKCGQFGVFCFKSNRSFARC